MDSFTFTSAFSVSDFLLAHDAELAPLALVQGCAVGRLECTNPPRREATGMAGWYRTRVITDLEQGSARLRGSALDQLGRDAAAAGADAVVGLRRLPDVEGVGAAGAGRAAARRVRRASPDTPEIIVPKVAGPITIPLQYQFVGTAVADARIVPRSASSAGETAGAPIVTTLAMDEVWKLRRAGWEIAGLVTASAYQARDHTSYRFYDGWEVTWVSELWAETRARALTMLRDDAAGLPAGGIVGLQTHVTDAEYEFTSNEVEMVGQLVGVELFATAIRKVGRPAPAIDPLTMLTLS